ncbi:oxidoreductase [Corynebacterium heidelbergense]|uniref:Oxidoreductase n=1 Tax=Corynebacterium heidelbergense TaxID=2055947 RepID=A0A364V8U2_9CORY|nr:oxidoreductase [Corynebacterium heidelbergense]RAV33083.1 oxidoreductase [Corynebacterium heidelbergense]WCZ37478.1 hypothetical protein CHEID_09765 [Corynebacterium heidelbergense]
MPVATPSNQPDPLAPLLELPGVADAVQEASDYVARVHRHPANLRGWDVTGAESVLRGARASAQIDGGSVRLPEDGQVADPILAGSLRVAEMLAPDGTTETQTIWRRAPLQIMAKINALASPEMSDPAFRQLAARGSEQGGSEFLVPGRPWAAAGGRLKLLAALLTGGSRVSAVVLSAVVHGELLALAPFAGANGVTARACSRLTTIASGLDPRGLGVPEVWWNRHRGEYGDLARAFAQGTPEAVGAWICFHAQGLSEGALEGKSIADASRP